jgi:hypothetical protein
MREGAWEIIGHPGYLGSKKDAKEALWNERYGEGKWRISWIAADGKRMNFSQVYGEYVYGYIKYFTEHLNEADNLTSVYAYGYDIDKVSAQDVLDPYALLNKRGKSNQFHNVAFNVALQDVTGLTVPFNPTGELIQVREGRPGTPDNLQPKGYRYSPGRILCPDPSLIPDAPKGVKGWWNPKSVEALYQHAKVLEVRS